MNKETVKDALDDLRARGEVYFSSDDVADTLGVEATTGEKSHISQLLNEIETVEKWAKSKNITWRLTDGGSP